MGDSDCSGASCEDGDGTLPKAIAFFLVSIASNSRSIQLVEKQSERSRGIHGSSPTLWIVITWLLTVLVKYCLFCR